MSLKKSQKKSLKPKAPLPKAISTGFWLLKSEPESYSIDAFAKDAKTLWTGVRNYQARNFMMETMKKGDRFLFYHSNAEPSAVAGVGEILRPNVADPTALDPKSDYYDPKSSIDHPIWFCAEVKFTTKLPRLVSLEELKTHKNLYEMSLMQKGQRLSVLPVSKMEFDFILKLASTKPATLKAET
jgi:predicted RNA-binding protein with PUA-like domain